MEITLKFGKGTPKNEMYMTAWFFVYQKMMKSKIGKWHYVEIPASKVRSAYDAIRQYFKHNEFSIEVKIDKKKIDDGIGVIWYKLHSRPTKRAPDLKRAARKSKRLSKPAVSSG